MAEESPKVRCAGCGFLGAKGADAELVTVDLQWRRTGKPSVQQTQLAPFCFRDHEEVTKEYRAAPDLSHNKEGAYVAAINAERECPDYCAFQPGHSPKEHAKMEALLREQQRAEKLAEQQRQWQKEFAAEQRVENVKAQKELIAERAATEQKRDRRQFIEKVVIAVLVPTLALVFALLRKWFVG